MKYQIHQLDGRHSYRELFQYYLRFSGSMNQNHGPLQFNQAMAWCIQTYGWSAEIREYNKISRWCVTGNMIRQQPFSARLAQGILTELPMCCNPKWSWSNRMGDDLRIYLASDAELGFFQLAHASE